MKAENKNDLFGWKANWLFQSDGFFFVSKIFESKVGKILFGADRMQFRLVFVKIQRIIIFAPYIEWSWNFQDSIFFIKASYGFIFSEIWGATHWHARVSWWIDMEWLVYEAVVHM